MNREPVSVPTTTAFPNSSLQTALFDCNATTPLRVLEEAHGNQPLATQMLGIDRVSLWWMLKKCGEEKG